MLTRAARKRQADAIEAAGLPNEEPPFKMLAYYPTVKKLQPWFEIVQVLLPEIAKNRFVEVNVNEHIERYNGVVDTDTLFMKSLVTMMGEVAESRHEELSKYLSRKSPDQFVNSGFNTSAPLMMSIFKCCNWEKVRERYFYVQIRKNTTEIHFGRREMFLKLDHGRDDIEKTIDVLSTILKLLIKARVSAIYVRSYGTMQEKSVIVGLKRIIELATLKRDREFVAPPYFKPISDKRTNRQKASAEHIYFIVTQTQDKARIVAENLYSERFLLFDRSREYRYFW